MGLTHRCSDGISRPDWTEAPLVRQALRMIDQPLESELRSGEVTTALPPQTDAGVYFIGVIHTPWISRRDCPKRGSPDGPLCSIIVDERWRAALSGLADQKRIQILYWMHQARRDLVLQAPGNRGELAGTFALRSPVRPNPIASSIVDLVSIDDGILQVRGLDCLDGTPLIDIKPEHGASETKNDGRVF
jgi:tRNA (adenine37-N6)-methyltransferase